MIFVILNDRIFDVQSHNAVKLIKERMLLNTDKNLLKIHVNKELSDIAMGIISQSAFGFTIDNKTDIGLKVSENFKKIGGILFILQYLFCYEN